MPCVGRESSGRPDRCAVGRLPDHLHLLWEGWVRRRRPAPMTGTNGNGGKVVVKQASWLGERWFSLPSPPLLSCESRDRIHWGQLSSVGVVNRLSPCTQTCRFARRQALGCAMPVGGQFVVAGRGQFWWEAASPPSMLVGSMIANPPRSHRCRLLADSEQPCGGLVPP